MNKIAVVILNWNGQKLLEQFLPAVIKNTPKDNVQIVVADNASTDSSVDFLKENYKDIIQLIGLPENYGFAGGYNKALEKLEAEYFVLLNSDVEVTPNWLYPLVDCLDNNKDIVAVQPKLLWQKQKNKFEYAGASGGFIDKYGFPFCRGRIFNTVEEDLEQYEDVVDVFWTSGACMAVRAKEYFEVGGLDANFFAHMEEIDLCWRFQSRGWRLVCNPQSTVYHVGGATLSEESAHKVYLNFRNNMLMLYKNLDSKLFKQIYTKRLLFNWIASIRFLFSGRLDKFNAVFKAHRDFKDMKKDYQAIRSKNVNRAVITKCRSVYNKSIVIDYYLKSKKKYSELIF